MKRLRISLARECGVTDTKYFACGEYGDHRGRPHYHAVFFGWDFPDRVPVKNNPGTQHLLYDSAFLRERWGKGAVRVGDLTAESAAYVARYTLKKAYGEDNAKEYLWTGRIPPFNLCSKGIGRDWFAEFHTDIFPCDFVVDEATKAKCPVPRFYDKLHQVLDAEAARMVKEARIAKAKLQSPERLKAIEECRELKIQTLRRTYDNEASGGRS